MLFGSQGEVGEVGSVMEKVLEGVFPSLREWVTFLPFRNEVWSCGLPS